MSKHLEFKAWILLLVFIVEIFSPGHIYALTSGPSQPEMASFTPYGTTEMVDPFTGDFSYNIPLLDVEGYPVNIAYNSGVNMEQEASWVGLGWSLNVGTVNRSVRGLPDDFKGDEIRTETNLKPMKITKVGGGIGTEVFGDERIMNLNFGANLNFVHNNYKGFGIEIGSSMGPSLDMGGFQAQSSVGFSLSSLDGASFNSSLGATLSKHNKSGKGFSFGGNVGTGYNTRTGQTMLSLGTTAGYSQRGLTDKGKKYNSNLGSSVGVTFLPIGIETYTPYPSIELKSETETYNASIGGEVPPGVHANANISGSVTTQELKETVINKPAYGYLYSEYASKSDLLDFNRDKQVTINKTLPNLSPTSFTYDVYSVSGQGISGTFRPFRNEISSLHDPEISDGNPNSNSDELGLEVGVGAYFHGGANINTTTVKSEYGPWHNGAHSRYNFKSKKLNDLYENVYFKAAGELTESDIDFFQNNLGEKEAIAFELNQMTTNPNLIKSDGGTIASLQENTHKKRNARAKHFSYFTADDISSIKGSDIYSYSGEFYAHDGTSGLLRSPISRVNTNLASYRGGHHIAEIVQSNPNGERFVYGIAAYNYAKNEVTYNTKQETSNALYGRVLHDQLEENTTNTAGVDYYFNHSTTRGYAHSFLLTEKQSPDYQDVTGDGVSSDDKGNAWKFNYTRKNDKYFWRTPYENSNFMEGFKTVDNDQKASFSYGLKELWYVHSIESKNQVAEFYISEREDALGSKPYEGGGVPDSPSGQYSPSGQSSYKLDSIVLYNKYDRITNKDNAIPIKTIVLKYEDDDEDEYELCKDIENGKTSGIGKLTLQEIQISYGGISKGKLSPYIFNYSAEDGLPGINPTYDSQSMDRWGNYKPSSSNPNGILNSDFPYSTQNVNDADLWASAWNLKEIITPTGGKITIDYEADRYAYVQDKVAMQMFTILGAGTTKSYSGSNNLYGSNYLYFECPPEIQGLASEVGPGILSKWFLGERGELDNMYFKFKTSIGVGNEYVPGYIGAEEVGYCLDNALNNTNYLYLKIRQESPNAISKTAWGYFRENLFDVLYDQPNINDSGVESLIKGIRANIADIRQMFIGVEDYLESKNIAKNFTTGESFVRLQSPAKSKIGGGSRVARIVLDDQWSDMSGEGVNGTYGQEYDYTTIDENGDEISSGVASYEPMIGNDENPFRTPVPYVSQGAQGHIPAISAYQESPLGETLFPSASVGYSKVTVTNIHKDVGKTSNAITEHNFYTAKDFPVIVKKTRIQKHNSPTRKPKVTFPIGTQTSRSEFAASQGFSIILNDMHGKPLSTRNYTIQTDVSGNSFEKVISGANYNYHDIVTKRARELNNLVDVISNDGSVSKKLLGVEYDIAIDSRSSYEITETKTKLANVDVLPGLGPIAVPFPMPTYYWNTVKDIKESKTVAITKVIQMYGIVESVENYTDQYATTVYNKLYDGTTGEVLLTQTEDEHKTDEYEFKVPAYLTPDLQRMGPAYENSGFEGFVELDRYCAGGGDYNNNGEFKHGDEVLITKSNGTMLQGWVDLNSSNNIKDPLIIPNSNCNDNAYLFNVSYTNNGFAESESTTGSINYFCDNTQTATISYSHDMGVIVDNLEQNIQIYLPKPDFVDYLLNPEYDPAGTIPNSDVTDQINAKVCELFGSSQGTSNIIRYLDFKTKYGFNSLNSYNVGDIFDINLPLDGEIVCGNTIGPSINQSLKVNFNEANKNSKFIDLLYNFQDDYHSAVFLIKVNHETLTDYESTYFIAFYKKNEEVCQNNYYAGNSPLIVREKFYVNNYTNDGVSTCPFTFKVIDRSDSYITDLTEQDKIKIIRSGNKNMLTANEGSVIATSNPLDIQNGFFQGIKDPMDIDISQVSAQEFSDGYELKNQSEGSNYNKFLIESDGSFNVQKTHRFISSRSQNKQEIETPKDGYLETLPPLWSRVPEDCYFMLTSPIKSSTSGWFVQEEITKFNDAGNSLEAQNDELGIYSSVIINPVNKTEAVASNTKQRNIGVESFENYKHLIQNREWRPHFAMLNTASPTTYNVGGDTYKETELTPAHDEILIKGVAHSGNYSIYLKGANPNGLTQIDYTEYSLNSLVNASIGEKPYPANQTVNLSTINYPSSIDQMEINFAEYYGVGSVVHDELSDAIYSNNGMNKLSYSYDPSASDQQGWQPEDNRYYYFSIWVKDIINSNLPYKGIDQKVEITVDGGSPITYKVGGPEIDGWYQITGEFEYTGGIIDITLDGGLFGSFFDDFRIHPVESNLQTYVYDMVNGRLKAQLDENNYTTFYSYNEEGIPSQVKKETSSGILTISESIQKKHNH